MNPTWALSYLAANDKGIVEIVYLFSEKPIILDSIRLDWRCLRRAMIGADQKAGISSAKSFTLRRKLYLWISLHYRDVAIPLAWARVLVETARGFCTIYHLSIQITWKSQDTEVTYSYDMCFGRFWLLLVPWKDIHFLHRKSPVHDTLSMNPTKHLRKLWQVWQLPWNRLRDAIAMIHYWNLFSPRLYPQGLKEWQLMKHLRFPSLQVT
jgi:hypothetical protein